LANRAPTSLPNMSNRESMSSSSLLVCRQSGHT
jgi:hypothetical protein